MSPILLFLLAFYQLQPLIHSEILNAPQLNAYSETENDINSIIPSGHGDDDNTEENENSNEMPLIKTGQDQTEIEFPKPIKSVNIDYTKNAIMLKFRKQHLQRDPHELEKYLMATDFMRFGKRAYELEPAPNENSLQKDEQSSGDTENGERFERSSENFIKNANVGLRDSRGDNFMRFGRNPADFMRFGRSPGQDFMRFGRDPADFMRFGRSPGQDFMRFGRDPGQDYLRFGRGPGQDFMRFGRNPGQEFMRFGRNPGQEFMRFGRSPGQDFMRFGRNPGQDFMRFGRNPGQDFMRFGRNPADFMRLGRSNHKVQRNTDKNFMRFGRPDNFMRFGRSQSDQPSDRSSNFMRLGRSNAAALIETDDKDNNNKTLATLDQKNELKAVAKIIHDSQRNNGDSNPMDKAIQVLFNKHNINDNELTKADENTDENETTQDYRR